MQSSHRWLCLAFALVSAFAPGAYAHEDKLEFFDIRSDDSQAGRTLRESFRGSLSKHTTRAAAVQSSMVSGKAALAAKVPNLRIDLNPFSKAPEIVDSEVSTLTGPSGAKRETIMRNFVTENASLFGLTEGQAGALKTVADYTNPAGNLSWVELEQTINGIPVFQGTVRAAVRGDGAIARTTGNLAAGLDEATLSATPKITASSAAAAAAKTLGVKVAASKLSVKSVKNDGRTKTLAAGPFTQEIQTDLVYFPLEPGVATLAYSMVLWQPVQAYYTIVDAQTGQLLWRKNITNDQSQTATYSIYNDDSPAPLSPTTALPGSTTQGAGIARSQVVVVSELPAFDNLGWITDGVNTTTGNNVDAGLDIDGTDGIDATGRPTGSPNRVFNFAYTPGGVTGGTAPTSPAYRNGAVTNLFFWTNRFHDRMYSYGFTEAARNFQNNNFGRGGVGNDRVLAQAQDSSGTDNANFSTPPDGTPGRMQMYIFSNPSPNRDGDLDQEISLHEMTHGLSNRLHANGAGLVTLQSGGMGEGWSDFYARCILSTAAEDLNGVYASGGYSTLNFFGLGTDNYYYGIRRFPYALKTALGANNKPHNPMTFADIDPAQNFLSDGAFAKSPVINATAIEVHNIGEIWCMALLEVRARIITRLGFAAGNDRILQIVTDGMKLDPASPTVVQARDSIIAADTAGFGAADVADIWAGFAAMGLGFNSTATSSGQAPAVVVESYTTPNLLLGNVTFSDAAAGNNNAAAEPGEIVTLTVPVRNLRPTTATAVTATVEGVVVAYGDIPTNQTVSKDFTYTVPPATPSGTRLQLPVAITSSFGAVGPVTPTFFLVVGKPVANLTQSFDGGAGIPAGWTTSTSGAGGAWTVNAINPNSAPNSAFAPNVAAIGLSELDTPTIPISSASAVLSFQIAYNLEAAPANFQYFDGAVLEMSIDGSPFQDVIAAGCKFLTGGYNACIDFFDNPLRGRSAWSGLSGGTAATPGYVATSVLLPASTVGHNVTFRWLVGCDSTTVATGSAGVRVDTVVVTGDTFSVVAGEAPVVTTSPGTIPYIENQPGQIVDGAITVTDADSTTMLGATVSFSANFALGQDVLSFTPGGNVTGTYNATTGVLSLIGNASPDVYEAVLRTVKYSNSSNNPTTVTRTIKFAVSDGAESGSGTRGVTVAAVNDAPQGNSVNVLTNEDTPKPFTLTAADPENSPVTFTVTQQPLHGQLTGVLPNVIYSPNAEYSGPDNFKFKVNDGQLDSVANATVNITVVPVNDLPIANGQNLITAEDTQLPVTLTGSDVENSPITFAVVAQPQHGTLSGSVPNLLYQPEANYFGPDSFTFRANDGTDDGLPAAVNITVQAINDPPTFTVGPDQVVISDATFKTVLNWATGVSPGPGEGAQTLAFTVLADQPGLFTTQPAVAPNGTLTFQALANAVGITTVTISAKDNGGTANGGLDTSATQTFKILVNPPNFVPTFTAGPDVIVPQGSSAYSQPWATNISAGAAHESAQVLNFIVQFDHPEIFSAAPAISPAGQLTFTPASGASGLATVTVRLHDDGGTANNGQDTSPPQVFTIAVATFTEEVGTYNGLIQPAALTTPGQPRFGGAKVTVAASGAVTGKLELGGQQYTVKGTVDLVGNVRFGKNADATTPLKRRGQSTLDLALHVDVSNGTDKIDGTITDGGNAFAALDADRALYTAKNNPTPPFMNPPSGLPGKYTVILGAQTPAVQGLASDLYPQGDGVAFITVSNSGTAKVTGRLADGSKISTGNALSKLNVLPFHLLTDKKKGSVTGPVRFRDIPGVSDLDAADITWVKPINSRARSYPGGWAQGIGIDVVGSAYAPAPGQPALPGLGAPGVNGNAGIALSSGGLAIGGLAKNANIDGQNKVLIITPTTDKLSLRIAAKTGAINGDFIFPVSNRRTKIVGVILQKSQRGAGYFVSDLASGHFSVIPGP